VRCRRVRRVEVGRTDGRVRVTALEVRDVHKSYGEQPVLRSLSLSVAPGAFVAILGPSGSGKTTLLRVIAGFERVDGGEVRLADEVVDDGQGHFVSSERRRIGYVPQEGSLFPHLSVEQNVGFGLPRAERKGAKVDSLLEMVGLVGLGRRYPHQLSGGQQQRVALARALAIRPTLVLLDEPFSSLDAGLRASVRADVRNVLREAGATAVLVTHDQDEALSLADEVAVISAGRIGQVDSPQGLYYHPGSPALARALGETNFVRGVARGGSVETPLGVLPLENAAASEGSKLLVLVRPEQISFEEGGGSLAGRVVECEFYGHDAVVRIRPEGEGNELIVARTIRDTASLQVGTPVHVRAEGAVVGWPDQAA